SKFIDVKGWKSQGNRLSQYEVKKVKAVMETIQSEPEKTADNKKESAKQELKTGTQLEWDIDTGEKKIKDGKQTKLF
ncbi:MAG: hypothetical protein KBD42_15035, partial [Chitinophagales bacterium]|nr:hypothetical protein [Chitinophagales bacterium]